MSSLHTTASSQSMTGRTQNNAQDISPNQNPQIGHDAVAAQLARLVPRPEEKGEKTMNWFDKLFQNIIVVASLCAGFSFSVVVAPLERIQNDHFTVQQVNTAVAVSWLLFVLAVTLSSAFSSFFYFDERKLGEKLTGQCRWTHSWMALVSLTVQELVLGGFLAASVDVAAFSKNVGYTTIGITIIAAIILPDVLQQTPRQAISPAWPAWIKQMQPCNSHWATLQLNDR
ncbi:hypothetical protein LTR70_002447 [Exophiala xenobiotica]|uniref:Uncharacterized protein n=1 Tax=Lithohypha guttulata TaxID=1690604 RepID=A0ABR0KLZ5_9EURO|nr:hypothetical protein LTR24_001444 [Lithohypha guttulata]KAK5325475.1 hypothetical protein LTR70_002447 [Exophiala xenobiotica]